MDNSVRIGKLISVVGLIFLAMTPIVLMGQEYSLWNNIRNSYYTQDEQIHIRSELTPLLDAKTSFYYYQQSVWQQGSLTQINGETYEAVVPVDREQPLYCRYKTIIPSDLIGIPEIVPGMEDSLVVMMPGYLQEYPTPLELNYLAKICDDPIGDVSDGVADYLDITSSYFSYSDTHLYSAITNNHTSFPTGSLFGPFNFYTTIIINPETVVQDSVFYGMIYGNITAILTPGLYRFSGANLEGLKRIGSLTHSISGNTLIKSCLIEDLTSDPYFGDFPNTSNSLIVAHATMRVDLSLEFTIGDVGRVSIQNFQKHVIPPHRNRLPNLSGLSVRQAAGVVNLSVDYYDPDNHFPIVSELVFADETKVKLYPLNFDYSNNVKYTAVFQDKGTSGMLRFSDNGHDFVELPYEVTDIDHYLAAEYNPLAVTLYPNPFDAAKSSELNISFSVPPTSNQELKVGIYNIKGQLIKEYRRSHKLNGSLNSSSATQLLWNGKDEAGNNVGTGVYFIKAVLEKDTVIERVLVVK